MSIKKYRWSRDYESAEEELLKLFASKHIEAARWTLEADEEIGLQVHNLDRRVWCAEGSLHYYIDGKKFSLQPGDALDMPALTVYRTHAGISGCAIYESPTPSQNPAVLQV